MKAENCKHENGYYTNNRVYGYVQSYYRNDGTHAEDTHDYLEEKPSKRKRCEDCGKIIK